MVMSGTALFICANLPPTCCSNLLFSSSSQSEETWLKGRAVLKREEVKHLSEGGAGPQFSEAECKIKVGLFFDCETCKAT